MASPIILENLQKMPNAGPERESLREKGQFWTPLWLARAMAQWVTEFQPPTLFDPAVGPGTFFAAARATGYAGELAGYELHQSAFSEGADLGLSAQDFQGVMLGDFMSARFTGHFPAIISNPPYIRHHRLGESRKLEMRQIAQEVLGFPLDGRAGLHVYFLLKCLQLLAPGGRLAFLLPADVFEGVSSRAFWRRIAELFRVEAVVTFGPAAAPFPKVDTNAIVILLSHHPPKEQFRWIRLLERDGEAISRALRGSGAEFAVDRVLNCYDRSLAEAVTTGLSRPPRELGSHGSPLADFARVVRGIASGANEFFFLTEKQISHLGLDTRFFVRALGRTRDCSEDILRLETLELLEAQGRPTWLLSLDGTAKEQLPAALQAYLRLGEQQKLHERALIKTRRPWYKMERRLPPPILFAYLGRRECRFILNNAGVVPLTGFLCVYPWDSRPDAVRRLWLALNHPKTLENLVFAGKSYGGGAVKVEPRQLDQLEIPDLVIEQFRLSQESRPSQQLLFQESRRSVET